MRVLQVIEFFTPKMGGSVQVAYQTARHLARRGHQVTVCTSNFGRREAEFPDGPFQVQYFYSLPTRWNFYLTPGLVPWAWKHLGEFDIIHMHNVRTFQNAVIGAIARRKGVPYVISAHGSLPYLQAHEKAKRMMDRIFGERLVREAAALIAVSPVEAEQYLAAGVPEEKIRVVYNGLDLEEFSQLPRRGAFREKYSLSDKTKIVLYVGRLHAVKEIDLLVDSFASLCRNTEAVTLVIAGPDDGALAPLQHKVDRLHLAEKVIFTGPVYGADKLSAYVDADVLVSPASVEIFGLAPFEAILCGTPVIAAEGSGLGRLVRQARAGFLFPEGDAQALSLAIQQALSDPDKARETVRAGQEFVHNCLSWELISGQVEAVYSSFLAQKRIGVQT